MTLKRILAIVALSIVTCALWAQNEVSLVVSGEGKDKEEATLKALRSAIEQAYGTFVSANTTVLNDQLVADEIVSLSSGNIQKYEYVSETQMPDGSTFVTLSATVSIDKLVSFTESKGMEAELKGGLFAMNIKKMEFDKQAEEKAVANLCKQLEAMLPTLFDYEIEVEEPKLGKGNNDVVVAFRVNAQCNDNMLNFSNTLIKNLVALSLTEDECQQYKKINQNVFDFKVQYPSLFLCVPLFRTLIPLKDSRDSNCIWFHDIPIEFGKKSKMNISFVVFGYAHNEYDGISFSEIANPVECHNDEGFNTICFAYYSNNWENVKSDTIGIIFKQKCIDNIANLPLQTSIVGNYRLDYKEKDTIGSSVKLKIGIPTFHFRSLQSLKLIRNLFNSWMVSMYDVEISDDIRDYRIEGIQIQNGNFKGEKEMTGIVYEGVPTFSDHQECTYYDHCGLECFWSSCAKNSHNSEEMTHPISIDEFRIYTGVLHYNQDEISKINKITVNNPAPPETNSIPEPQESKSSNIANVMPPQPQSKTNLYNDTLQQAVNEYNALLKKFPYNYNENKIAFVLSSSLPDDEGFLRDTLHSLLDTISAKRARLVAQYKKDSLEFQQLNNSYQEKIDEANIQFLKYPYNLQKRTLKDSLSISLFGKTEELTKQLRTKVAALPQMQEHAEKEVYAETKKNNPQRFTEIYFAQNPTAKQKADSTFLECRCGYDCRLTFDMDFINNALPECNCREKKYQALKTLYHSREEFDQSYNQEESAFESEVTDRKKMWKEIKKMEEMLSNWKQLNTKKALSSTKTEIMDILNRVKQHQGSYYYDDAIDVIFAYDEKLSKEWFKNGSYFKSRIEMYEYWIGEEYDKVLKARKKE